MERKTVVIKDHWEDGFEREEFVMKVWVEARDECNDLKFGTFIRIIEQMCPDASAGLFARRPCVRRLKYIGYRDFKVSIEAPHQFFKLGKIYQSLTFNGGTYSIAEYEDGEKLIGCAYFDRIT